MKMDYVMTQFTTSENISSIAFAIISDMTLYVTSDKTTNVTSDMSSSI